MLTRRSLIRAGVAAPFVMRPSLIRAASLINTKSLRYPGGRTIINPLDPLLQNLNVWGVAQGAAFVNQYGAKGINTGSPAASIDGNIGPAVAYGASSTYTSWANTVPATPTIGTFLSIFRLTSVTVTGLGSVIAACGTTGSGGVAFCAIDGYTNNHFSINSYGNNSYDSGFAPLANVPYFGAASFLFGVATFPVAANFVLRNLANGELLTTEITNNFNIASTGNGTFAVAAGPEQNPFNGSIATTLFSSQFATMTQLVKLSETPWTEWVSQPFFYSLDWLGKTSGVAPTGMAPLLPMMGLGQ